MGKAARKKTNKKKQFYKDPKVEETETPESKELLYGLDSADPKIRISTSGAISAMFGDVQSDLQFEDNLENQYKSNLDMILNSQLLKKIIGRATDNEYMVCMNILGALRNMCIVGGESFIAKICELNVIIPLKNLLYKYVDFLKNGNENEQLITCNLYYQLFSLLTIILSKSCISIIHSDYDISGFYELESNDSQNIYSVLYTILQYVPGENRKLHSLCSMMQISLTEFVSIIEDQFDSTNPFLREVFQLADSKEWSLRYRIVNLCSNQLNPSQRLTVVQSILETLKTLSVPSFLTSLSACYEKFKELESVAANDKEEVIDDAAATAMMDVEALDANSKDSQTEVVTESEILHQQILDYRVVLDILSHLLLNEDQSPLQLSNDTVTMLTSFINTFIGQLESLSGLHNQADLLRHQLLAAILEVEGAIIPYLSDLNTLLTVWSQLVKYCNISADITSSIIKALWTWSQVMINNDSYSDNMNPVCFPEQIAPVTAILPHLECEDLVQTINLLSSLLQPVTPSDTNTVCLTEVCKQVVHVLDLPANANNAEVIGNIIDFMMTIFGNEKYVPIFKSLQLNQFVYDATNALRSSLNQHDRELDDDCREYLYEILDNAVRFIGWIQGGMK